MGDTIARLSALKAQVGAKLGASRLTPLDDFGSNPGELIGHSYVPQGLQPGAPLVVVLHGCTQTAAGYDAGSGWSELADRHGFALLYPEQRSANMANLCFSWYLTEDSRRGSGEPASIMAMVDAMVARHAIDADRVFVTGLSAGGAMASILLATYADRFAAGAIIAGLPYRCATDMRQALERMRGHGGPNVAELARLIRDASPGTAWPRVAVWHGGADRTVAPSNARMIVDAWRAVHGIAAGPVLDEARGKHARRVWRDTGGRDAVEEHIVAGMGHGTPIDPDGPAGCGTAMPFMLDVGVSSTQAIAASFGIAPAVAQSAKPAKPRGSSPAAPAGPAGVGRVIDDALRAAGLVR